MKNIRFSPPQITVKAGTTVIWTNDDTVGHTVTSGTRGNPSGLFDSGDVPAGGTFSFTFTEPGTYNYYCKIHPGMDGVVIVEK
jgi:plastocyanin